jgi:hypothetical protein
MKANSFKFAAIAVALFASSSAFASSAQPSADPSSKVAAVALPSAATTAATKAKPAAKVRSTLPLVVVNKSATCSCCNAWVDHLRAAGFLVEVRNSDNLDPIKDALGVPVSKRACHTAQVGGYFIEGHVPASDIKHLLAQKPKAKGLAVPGMPMGSPGMTTPDGSSQPYTVELVATDGSTTTFARH